MSEFRNWLKIYGSRKESDCRGQLGSQPFTCIPGGGDGITEQFKNKTKQKTRPHGQPWWVAAPHRVNWWVLPLV